jgi:hypothetical protein
LFYKLLEKKQLTKQRAEFLAFPRNKYSRALKVFQRKRRARPRFFKKARFKDYRYAIFLRRLTFNLPTLPFSKKKKWQPLLKGGYFLKKEQKGP